MLTWGTPKPLDKPVWKEKYTIKGNARIGDSVYTLTMYIPTDDTMMFYPVQTPLTHGKDMKSILNKLL